MRLTASFCIPSSICANGSGNTWVGEVVGCPNGTGGEDPGDLFREKAPPGGVTGFETDGGFCPNNPLEGAAAGGVRLNAGEEVGGF